MSKIALISVTNKQGLDLLIPGLVENKYDTIIASGKTFEAIEKIIKSRKLKVSLRHVSEFTKFPEILDGRIKTIHPLIEGSIMWNRKNPIHQAAAKKHGLMDISCVVCNFYDVDDNESRGMTEEKLRDYLDIGGPALVMSAVKNWPHVISLVDPSDYSAILKEMKENKGILSEKTRMFLAAKALNYAADYRAKMSMLFTKRWLGEDTLRLKFVRGKQLGRYGENWHQRCWLFVKEGVNENNAIYGKQLHGPELGFNNYIDLQSAMELAYGTKEPCAVVIKHNNPCGYATGKNLVIALERAWQGDPISAFGCVLGFNIKVDLETVKVICDRLNPAGKYGWFVEAIIAPEYSKDAIDYIKGKTSKAGLRVIETGSIGKEKEKLTYRCVTGGVLVQDRNDSLYLTKTIDELFQPSFKMKEPIASKDLVVGIVTKINPDINKKGLFEFTYRVCMHAKSNAITICREYSPGFYQLIGLGCGQPNRTNAAGRLAVPKAVENLKIEYNIMKGRASEAENEMLLEEYKALRKLGKKLRMSEKDYVRREFEGCVAASDAFFPFIDGINELGKAGIKNIIQPGGSMRDEEIIKTVDKFKMSMIFTGRRHFNH